LYTKVYDFLLFSNLRLKYIGQLALQQLSYRKIKFSLVLCTIVPPTWYALLEETVLGRGVPVESLPVGPEQAVLL
jgi:hypothetical protein